MAPWNPNNNARSLLSLTTCNNVGQKGRELILISRVWNIFSLNNSFRQSLLRLVLQIVIMLDCALMMNLPFSSLPWILPLLFSIFHNLLPSSWHLKHLKSVFDTACATSVQHQLWIVQIRVWFRKSSEICTVCEPLKITACETLESGLSNHASGEIYVCVSCTENLLNFTFSFCPKSLAQPETPAQLNRKLAKTGQNSGKRKWQYKFNLLTTRPRVTPRFPLGVRSNALSPSLNTTSYVENALNCSRQELSSLKIYHEKGCR